MQAQDNKPTGAGKLPYRRPAFWAIAACVTGVLLFVLSYLNYIKVPEILERMESSLLDQRLRYRAQEFTPSSKIVIVAIDEISKDYFETHPELNIDVSPPPRYWVARVVDFLNQQGAERIILDTEFISRRAPGEDKALAEAIARAGNVYLAAYKDIQLDEFMGQEGSRILAHRHFAATTLFYPQIRQDARTHRWLPGGCGVAPLALQRAFINIQMDSKWPEYWSRQCKLPDSTMFAPATFRGDYLKSTDDPIQESYARLCTEEKYIQRFGYPSEFLSELEDRHVNAVIDPGIKRNAEGSMFYCRISYVVPDFLKPAMGLGIDSVDYNKDAFLRFVPALYFGYKGNPYLYTGIAVGHDLLGKPPLHFRNGELSIGDKKISLVSDRYMMVNWRNPKKLIPEFEKTAIESRLSAPEMASFKSEIETLQFEHPNTLLNNGHVYRFVSLADIVKKITESKEPTPSLYALNGRPLTGDFDFKDAIVIYGDTIKDIHRTPQAEVIAGPEIVATVIDNILHDDSFVHQSAGWVNALIVIIISAVIIYAILYFKRLHIGFLSGVLVLVAFWMYNFVAFKELALWIPLVWPTLVGLTVLTGSTLYRYYVQDREKRELTGVFSKYVSPQIMNQILVNPATAMQNLQGSKKELTVMFTDIHNFTSQFEDSEPDQIVQHLNEYFNTMTNIVLAYEGTCDKYMGDSLMAFFGAPTDLPDHADKACRAALTMQKALDALNIRRQQQGKSPIRHGIGISTGPMFVGNFGSDEIKNFSVVGSVVNLGARLETQTRASNVPIIISEATYAYVKHWAKVADLGKVVVKGFSQPVQIFALEGDLSETGQPEAEREEAK